MMMMMTITLKIVCKMHLPSSGELIEYNDLSSKHLHFKARATQCLRETTFRKPAINFSRDVSKIS